MRRFLFLCLMGCSLLPVWGQTFQGGIKGKVVDQDLHPIEMINILIKGTTVGTISNSKGEFFMPQVTGSWIDVVFSAIGYQKVERRITLPCNDPVLQIMKLDQRVIQEIVIEKKRGNNDLQTIQPKLTERLPTIGGGVETLIKTLPGVSNNNELSSQYSVRGGNFDENLVYVNGIEIIRPFLVKSGEQEGLSFINSEMVSTIGFSAGGFDASYGDKMSSVLDITYRKPERSSAVAEIGALGASALLEGASSNGKFTYLAGFRYKNTAYLLGTLDKKGEYNPSFTDLQTYLNYRFSSSFSLGFLGNYASNTFQFIPKTQLTRFGTLANPHQFQVYFDGKEKDRFENYLEAFSADYTPNSKLSLKFQGSYFYSYEKESQDILGEYYLSDVNAQPDSQTYPDSSSVTGTGSDLGHARNLLTANIISVEQRGSFTSDYHQLQWGLKYQHENVHDFTNEWEMRDSAGYSLPYRNNDITLYHTATGNVNVVSNRYSGFLKDNWFKELDNGLLEISGGVRFQTWDYNNQTIISPRISASWKTGKGRNKIFRVAWGIYDQMPFLKELIDPNAQLVKGVQAQKSIHYVIGYDKIISTFERPIRFTTELWYKALSHLIPYQIDNLKIQYLPDQVSRGYAAGVDFKIKGELPSGAQSWASLSLMKTEEDIIGDYYIKNSTALPATKIYPGYIPRPTDQRFNFSFFIQDYFPGYPSVKMSMTMFYGSRLPFGPPNGQRYLDTFRMPPYQRVDAGFSKTLIDREKGNIENKKTRRIKEAWIGFDIFNLFDMNNTISYYWVSDIHNQMYAVPNYLTGRRLNLRFSIRF